MQIARSSQANDPAIDVSPKVGLRLCRIVPGQHPVSQRLDEHQLVVGKPGHIEADVWRPGLRLQGGHALR